MKATLEAVTKPSSSDSEILESARLGLRSALTDLCSIRELTHELLEAEHRDAILAGVDALACRAGRAIEFYARRVDQAPEISDWRDY